jgi:hypothetical protein
MSRNQTDGSANTMATIKSIMAAAPGATAVTELSQSDFTKPYVIDKPGIYRLTEDIKLNFYNKPYDIFNVESTKDDLFGFPAGIKIISKYVTLDLSGHTLFQSPQDFCVQRFFALIQLNNSPFAINKGPIPEARCNLESASFCVIKNGQLGLTAHQAILGNDNNDIILENLTIVDYEVTAVTLNNVNTVYFNNVSIDRSIGVERILPVSPYFSGLIFNYRLLKLTFLKFFINIVEQKTIVETNTHIRNVLTPFLNVIYSYNTLTCIYEQLKHLAFKVQPYLRFLLNESKVSPCGIHGIKITGPNPSVTNFHQSINDDPEYRRSKNVFIYDSSINNILAEITPVVCFTLNKKPIHIGAGMKFGTALINQKVIVDLIATMNVLSKNPNIAPFIRTTVNNNVVEFTKCGKDKSNTIGMDGAFDIMGHVQKGIMGIRIGSTSYVDLSGVSVTNIRNNGKKLHPNTLDCLKKTFGICDIDFSHDTFLSPMNYHGSYSMGSIISGSTNIDCSNVNIYDMTAPFGAAVGLAINNQCDTVSLYNTNVYDLVSCSSCFDSATFVIDEQSKNITTNKMILNPASSTLI